MKKIIKSQVPYLFAIGLVLISIVSCKTEIEPMLPILSTETISSITQNTAVCGGNITSDNGLEVTTRGVCWSLKPNPTIIDSLTKDATGKGKFISNLKNLLPDTTYYVRAYATNSDGTAYGLQVTFRTLKVTIPILSTTEVINETETCVISGGNITSNGGSAITQRGVCWNTTGKPTVENSKTVDGTGDGKFSSSLSGLTPQTKYYARAYATNKTGTAYGETLSFFTHGTFTDLRDGHVYKTVTIGTQTWMAENLAYLPVSASAVTVGSEDSGNDGKSFYYINDNSKYGVLYNWHAALTAAPAGWHLPTDAEWTTLINYLGNESDAGRKMKSTTGWISPNTGATNSSYFTALPGGGRIDNSFSGVGIDGVWWSSTEYDTNSALARTLRKNYIPIDQICSNKYFGFSVRCIRN